MNQIVSTRVAELYPAFAMADELKCLISVFMAGAFSCLLRNSHFRATPAARYTKTQSIPMQIKPLTQATRAEVLALAQTAANCGEPLDAANVFPVGTVQRLQFMNDYHDQIDALEAA